MSRLLPIAVVGYEGVVAAGCAVLEAVDRNAVGGCLGQQFQKLAHCLALELVLRFQVEQLLYKLGIIDLRHYVSHRMLEAVFIYKLGHFLAEFQVGIGGYIFEMLGYNELCIMLSVVFSF